MLIAAIVLLSAVIWIIFILSIRATIRGEISNEKIGEATAMSAKAEFLNIGSNDESADRLSPWQVAKRIAGEFTGSHSEFRSFADDSCIEVWLEAEV